MPIDTANIFLVCAQADPHDAVAILRPPIAARRLSADEAINLAAWLVALVPDGEQRFAAVLRSVKNT